MSEEFQKFVSNVYKLSVARRPIEAPDKLVTLESLWLTELCTNPPQEVVAIYKKCKEFLESYIKEAKNVDDLPVSKMGFDHKTANAVIPEFSGDSSKVLDFIDCVTYYSETLNESEKSTLLTFINKVKLRGKAKLSVMGQNDTLTNLLSALRSRYQPRVTLASTQSKLSSLQQKNRPITEFVNEIETLVGKLSELQVEKCGESSRSVVTAINDTVALNALKMGADDNIKKVLLSSSANSFSEAVSAALDAEASFQVFNGPTQAQVNYIHKKHWNGRGKYGNRGNQNNHDNRNNQGTNQGNQGGWQNRGKRWRGRGRGRGQSNHGQQQSNQQHPKNGSSPREQEARISMAVAQIPAPHPALQ